MANDVMMVLLEATIASTLAILLVAALRVPLRRHLGAAAAHALWSCVPLACVAILLPARQAETQWALPLVAVVQPIPITGAGEAVPFPSLSSWLPWLWCAGAIVMTIRLALQQRRFIRGLGELAHAAPGVLRATTCNGLPAAYGVLRPKVVVPADFHTRYDPEERDLVLCHERLHIRRGDLAGNLLAALLRSLFWFNPLMHLAARLHRLDQEFACDAGVIARHPRERRRYGEAMLKAHLAGTPLPVGCHWTYQHPLKERIAMLKHPLHRRPRRFAAATFVMLTVAGAGIAAWAAQPVAQTQAVHDFHYRIGATLEVDGERQGFALRDWPGRKVGFATTTQAGHAWRVELTIDPAQPGQVKLVGDIRVDGKPVSAPVLIGTLDEQMRIEVTPPEGGSTFALSMIVSRHTGAPGPDAAGVPKQPAPAYPEEAKALGQSGHVVLKLRVGPDGRVREAVVEESVPAGLFDAASLAAAQRWIFDPPKEHGVPVEGWVRVPIQYDIDGGSDGDGAGASETDSRTAWSTLDPAKLTSLRSLECDEMRFEGDGAGPVICGQRLGTAP